MNRRCTRYALVRGLFVMVALVCAACAGRSGRPDAARAVDEGIASQTLLAVLAQEARVDSAAAATACLALRPAGAHLGELGDDPPAEVVVTVRRAYPGVSSLSVCRKNAQHGAPPGAVLMTIVWAPAAQPAVERPYAAGVIRVRDLGAFSLSGRDYECRYALGMDATCELATVWNT